VAVGRAVLQQRITLEQTQDDRALVGDRAAVAGVTHRIVRRARAEPGAHAHQLLVDVPAPAVRTTVVHRIARAAVRARIADRTITRDRHALVGVPVAAGAAVGDTLLVLRAVLRPRVALRDAGEVLVRHEAHRGGRRRVAVAVATEGRH